jgi:hypothetical protein
MMISPERPLMTRRETSERAMNIALQVKMAWVEVCCITLPIPHKIFLV